ncbi:Adenosylmethionine-8-amino-7-oxononanoate aminotransferase [Anaeromicropila populeti]|uniref:Adenosylmethionine-8-amino-7-oxononanoate aminotransferase n=1 Tax=Anaeromicropila populeti TaxID=37658 RepID=A0A1I6L0G7_9FIRM|nr:Adenosylmethionine-8-amino-7-oxononanoate aminotransferase [Anaeromicropila populeti]
MYTGNALDEENKIIAKGEGIYLWDVQGKKYIDALSGLGVVNIGHCNQQVVAAIKEQSEQLEYISPFMGFSHPSVLKLVDLLSPLIPIKNPKFYFVNSGSEAVERAIMIAKQYHIRRNMPNKQMIIGLEGSFHGSTLACFSVGGLPNLSHFYGPLLPGTIKADCPNCYRCEFQKESCNYYCIQKLKKLIQYYRSENIAAFIMEPIMNAKGIVVPPTGYVKKAYELCRENDILFICDEIVTGFGRTGSMFVAQEAGIQPDIITVAKGLSSGYIPISAAIISEQIADEFTKRSSIQNVYGSTFGGHPIACAAAYANVKVILEDNLVENANEIGQYIEEKFKSLYQFNFVGDIRGRGLMWGIELVKDKKSKERYPLSMKLSQRMESGLYEKGLLCRVAADVIRLCPPLISSKEDIDNIYTILYDFFSNLDLNNNL